MTTTSKALSALLQKSTIDDPEESLKECNAALKNSKNDSDLLHFRVVALLKLERYEDALQALKDNQQLLKDRACFEKAYALYKLGNFEEAKETVREHPGEKRAKHLEAQASYRSEDFAAASLIYKALSQEGHIGSDDENDLRINQSAVNAQLEWTRQGTLVEKKKATREDLEIFETAYNHACAAIARGDLGQASFLLKTAQDVCSSNEDLSDEDKAAEILPIRVQQIYVLSRLGKHDEAQALASQISTQDITDHSTKQIARTNLLVASRDSSNLYLSRRALDTKQVLPETDRLFSYQADRLKENDLALDLAAQKPKSVISDIKSTLSSSQPTASAHVNILSTLNAAAHAQGDLTRQGLKQILPLFEKRPADVGLAMTIIQLYILTNNKGSAIDVIDKLLSHLSKSNDKAHEDVRYAPGLVALQVSLYRTQNRKSQIQTALAGAASYWWHKSKPPTSLLQAAGTSLLDSQNPEHQDVARKVFNKLRELDPASKIAAAGFIASHAQKSPDAVTEKDLSLLPSVEEQIKGVDVASLEEAGIPSLPDSAAITQKRPLDDKSKPAKKRNRHSRLPKDYDPSKKADPERWLPLKERSYYKPPKKKGKRRDGERERERTQGGVVNEKPAEKGGEVLKGSEKAVGGSVGGKNKGKKKGRK